MRATVSVYIVGAIGSMFVPRAAWADGNPDDPTPLPVSFAQRPLTLPKLVLAPTVDVSVERGPTSGAYQPWLAAGGLDQTATNLGAGVSFGAGDDLQLEIYFLPLEIAPSLRYGEPNEAHLGPTFDATYRLSHGNAEVGARFAATIVTYTVVPGQPEKGFVLAPAVPLVVHLGRRVRIDTGLIVSIRRISTRRLEYVTAGQHVAYCWDGFSSDPSCPANSIGVSIPLAVAVDIIEPLHIGALTGNRLEWAGQDGGVAIPLGFFAGYAVSRNQRPVVEIDPFFTWPFFATPTAQGTTDMATLGDFFRIRYFATGVGITSFLFL